MKMSTIEKVQEDVLVDELTGVNNEIVLYNDDVNTFDHVIDTLIRVCQHTAEQAEQCAMMIHHKGKCGVKSGGMDELLPIAEALDMQELHIEII
jgi:ATP-dependent Clp protease adaptor protein ClpS